MDGLAGLFSSEPYQFPVGDLASPTQDWSGLAGITSNLTGESTGGLADLSAAASSDTGSSFWDGLGTTLTGLGTHALQVGGALGNLAIDAYGQQAAGTIYKGSGTTPPATATETILPWLLVGGVAVVAVILILKVK